MEEIRVEDSKQVVVSDRVTFDQAGRKRSGHVAKKGRKYAHIVCDDGAEFRVPYVLLSKVVGAEGKHVRPRAEKLRAQFHVNDRVSFEVNGKVFYGTISRLNPRAAHVVCDNDEYRVSYVLLVPLEQAQGTNSSTTRRNETEVAAIAARATRYIDQHSLVGWSFQFDNGTKRAGCCDYRKQLISLSQEFARCAREEEIEDTILHEIAHALVGKDHGHDAVWRAKAVEIGCSGERCHDVQFTRPRYIVRCENDCWASTAERRRRGVVCKKCKGKVLYVTYTDDRWRQERVRVEGQ